MFDSSSYVKKLLSHLEDNVTEMLNDVDVITKFPANYISYPLCNTALVVSCKKIEFTSVSANPSGSIVLQINIYTARDRGLFAHQNVIDQTLNALCSFQDYSFAEIAAGEADFNRVSSAICSEITATVNLGQPSA